MRRLFIPLRFLAPLIWGSFDLSKYDVVISSASWYVTKGFGTRGKGRPVEICYCHTPPRWLYGYRTSVEWQKFWPVKLYGMVVGHFMRMYDFKAAQRVDYFVANSEEVRGSDAKILILRQSQKSLRPSIQLNQLLIRHMTQKLNRPRHLPVQPLIISCPCSSNLQPKTIPTAIS